MQQAVTPTAASAGSRAPWRSLQFQGVGKVFLDGALWKARVQ